MISKSCDKNVIIEYFFTLPFFQSWMVDKFETDLYSEYDGIFVFPMVGGIVHCKQMCDVFTFYFPHIGLTEKPAI